MNEIFGLREGCNIPNNSYRKVSGYSKVSVSYQRGFVNFSDIGFKLNFNYKKIV